ncbi:GNAT family N-acetyltransferase [Bizionia sp. KMM 8389]
MISNPFSSDIFVDVWSKHFNKKPVIGFKFIKPISFYKHRYIPCYINSGNKLTNGLTYTLNLDETDYKNKVFLVRDIPSYQHLQGVGNESRLKIKKVFQYEGYITHVHKYESLDAYLKSVYKSNTRSKLRRNIKRLEANFTVNYKMYYGEIDQETFASVFDSFYALFDKRYSNKGEPCGELEPKLWAFYTELAYKMINNKQASLFVIYCDDIPVGITFSYHFETILVEALTVFDIDFYRYNIGHTTILKMLEWSFENDVEIFDYTQGDFDYKKRWSDDSYLTHYHILYDSKSVKSKLVAGFLEYYFNCKRVFRERNYSAKIHQFKHRLFGSYNKKTVALDVYKVENATEILESLSHLKQIDIKALSYMSQRKALYDYLYMNPDLVKNLVFFKGNNHTIYAKGSNGILKIVKDEA